MAIRARNVALGDLRADVLPPSPRHEQADRFNLHPSVAVVKLQHDPVRLSAVDAGARASILANASADAGAVLLVGYQVPRAYLSLFRWEWARPYADMHGDHLASCRAAHGLMQVARREVGVRGGLRHPRGGGDEHGEVDPALEVPVMKRPTASGDCDEPDGEIRVELRLPDDLEALLAEVFELLI